MYAKDRGCCVTGRCYGSSHVLIQVFVLILWVVHASAGPPIPVAIPFCPKDLVPFVGAPVHRKCWVVIEGACESLFCYVCELPESLIHLRGSGPVVLYLDLPNGFVIFDYSYTDFDGKSFGDILQKFEAGDKVGDECCTCITQGSNLR